MNYDYIVYQRILNGIRTPSYTYFSMIPLVVPRMLETVTFHYLSRVLEPLQQPLACHVLKQGAIQCVNVSECATFSALDLLVCVYILYLILIS